jgi:hypothetical protein
MPVLVSSNWAAWFLVIGTFLLTEFLLFQREHQPMREWWKKRWRNLGLGLLVTAIVYGSLFLWSTVQTVYDDHHDSVTRWRAVVNEKDQLKQELKDRDGYISHLLVRSCPLPKPCTQGARQEGNGSEEQEKAQRLDIRTKLSEFLARATQLKAACLTVTNMPCEQEATKWLNECAAYIQKNMEPSYYPRFINASGLTLSYNAAKTETINNIANQLTFKAAALDEFIKEMR